MNTKIILSPASVFFSLLLIQVDGVFWRWKKLSSLDLSTVEPAGYTETHAKDLYVCRWKPPGSNGYIIGEWHEPAGLCLGVDADGKVAVQNDKDKIGMLSYPSSSVTWQRAFSSEVVEALQPYMIPAGKDSINASEKQYICRFVAENEEKNTEVVVIGRYLMSKPMICMAAWDDKQFVQSSCMEILISTFYNEVKTGGQITDDDV